MSSHSSSSDSLSSSLSRSSPLSRSSSLLDSGYPFSGWSNGFITSRLPFSLQDICMLHVIFRVDEFPAKSLALLPSAIRRHLFHCLPCADVLHLSDTQGLFSDIEELEDYQATACKNLIDAILNEQPVGMIYCHLQDYTEDFWLELDFYRIICEMDTFTTLGASLIMEGRQSVVVPKHLEQFLEIEDAPAVEQDGNIDSVSLVAWSFLHYCNMHCAPSELKIECNLFEDSVWCNRSDKQLVVPFLQGFLSRVEVLELGTSNNSVGASSISVAAPYVPLYNIVTSNEPRLKHLKVSGSPKAIETILLAVAELFCTTKCELCSKLSRDPPKPVPCPLERLTLIVQSSCEETSSMKHRIPCALRSILEIKTIRSVEVENECFTITPSFVRILLSLTPLLKQPQFETLNVDKSSFEAAYKLIKVFLTTPTTQEQKLHFRQIDKEKETSPEVRKRKKRLDRSPPKKAIKLASSTTISQSLPDTNTQYKCLDLMCVCSSDIHSWLFSLPELKLKELTILTQHIPLVHKDIVIQVEHVVFNTQVDKKSQLYMPYSSDGNPVIEYAHLEKFVISNTALKRLEFYSPVDRFIFPALNRCLSVLYQQGRGMEELIVHTFQFDRIDHIRDFLVQLHNLYQSYGTTLVSSAYSESEITDEDDSLEHITSMLNNFCN